MTRLADRGLDSTGRWPDRTRFSVVDQLTCYHDRQGEPANVHLEVRIRGGLDDAAFRASVMAMLAEQPRVRARRAAGGRWRRNYDWEHPSAPDLDPVSASSWTDESDLAAQRAAFLSQSPSLDSSPPLRFLLAHGPQQDCVILNAHHALLDGRSCLALLQAVSRHYSGQPGLPPDDARWLDGHDEQRSARFETPGGLPVQAVAQAVIPAVLASQPVLPSRWTLPGRVARIARRHAGGTREHRYGYGVQVLTWDRLSSVRGPLNVLGGSVNDLLMAAMMVAVSRWNESNGRWSGRIRITMPIGDRTQQSVDRGWGNCSRLAAVTARVTPGVGVGQLIAEVAPQTRYAKENLGPPVDLASRCLAAAPAPAAVKRQLLRATLRLVGPLVCDTSLVSNLGVIDPPAFGSAAVSETWFSTSAHMPRGLSLGVITIGGRLYLCFRYRRALLSDSAAAEFAAGYVDVLNGFANQEPQC